MTDFDRGYLMGRIDHQCLGWSKLVHFSFFEKTLELPQVKNICVLGVYHGRDLAYIQAILSVMPKECDVTGVDLFEDVPGTDWPDGKRGLSWEAAGFGPPPSVMAASHNLLALGYAGAHLVKCEAKQFLRDTQELFDFIYIDVAHDYQTTIDLIELGANRLAPSGILAGDDYADSETWGVKQAVDQAFPAATIIEGRIWCVMRAA